MARTNHVIDESQSQKATKQSHNPNSRRMREEGETKEEEETRIEKDTISNIHIYIYTHSSMLN